MTNNPYNVGDEVLIRGKVRRVTADGTQLIINPSTGGMDFYVHPRSITQCTPAEPAEQSVVLDRYNRAWQRIDGMWQQGDVAHSWDYLREHVGPVRVVHRAGVQNG